MWQITKNQQQEIYIIKSDCIEKIKCYSRQIGKIRYQTETISQHTAEEKTASAFSDTNFCRILHLFVAREIFFPSFSIYLILFSLLCTSSIPIANNAPINSMHFMSLCTHQIHKMDSVVLGEYQFLFFLFALHELYAILHTIWYAKLFSPCSMHILAWAKARVIFIFWAEN